MLCLVLLASLAAIFRPSSRGGDCIADVFQDGELLTSIPLDGSGTPGRFTVTGENGCVNEIEVRSHSIGVISADCPDKLCVQQGFVDSPGIPIVCLPNKLVIRLRDAESGDIDVIVH